MSTVQRGTSERGQVAGEEIEGAEEDGCCVFADTANDEDDKAEVVGSVR